MQIPAGGSRRGSAERLTDGGWSHPVARQGPANEIEVPGARPRKSILWAVDLACLRQCAPRVPSGFGLRCVLGSGHDLARDLPHMLARIGELTLQELRLDLHGLLKVS